MLVECGLYVACIPGTTGTCVVRARSLLWELYLVSQDKFMLHVFYLDFLKIQKSTYFTYFKLMELMFFDVKKTISCSITWNLKI